MPPKMLDGLSTLPGVLLSLPFGQVSQIVTS